MLVSLFATLSLAISPIIATPLPSTPHSLHTRAVQNGITTDGPATLPQSQTENLPLICPYGIQKGTGAKNILFVHGTGGTGDATWKGGMPDAFHAKGSVSP